MISEAEDDQENEEEEICETESFTFQSGEQQHHRIDTNTIVNSDDDLNRPTTTTIDTVSLYQGDAITIMKDKLSNDSITVCITDPPYSGAFIGTLWAKFKSLQSSKQKRRDSGRLVERSNDKKLFSNQNTGGTPGSWSDHFYEYNQEYEEFCIEWMTQVYRVLKPGGFLCMFSCIKLSHKNSLLAEKCGFIIKDQLIWQFSPTVNKGKTLHRITGNESDKTISSCVTTEYEPILVLQKPWQTKRYYPTLESNYKLHQTGLLDTKLMRHILHFDKPDSKERGKDNPHYSVKPIKLMECLVSALTKHISHTKDTVESIVLDPFVGSGTTLLACDNLGIRCIGMEIEPEFYEYAQNRILLNETIKLSVGKEQTPVYELKGATRSRKRRNLTTGSKKLSDESKKKKKAKDQNR